MSATWVLLTVVNATTWLLPDAAADKFGWALRARLLDSRQPYLVGEYLHRREDVHHPRLLVALGNQTKEDRKYLLLNAARVAGSLRVTILRPDGKPLPWTYYPGMKLLFDTRWDLAAGKWDSFDFDFGELNNQAGLSDVGVYELRASLGTAEGSIVSPPIKFKVIEPAADAVLASHPIALEGYEAKWPKERQRRPVIQQITIESRTWLVYRRFASPNDGGKASYTHRLAELPGKVDVKVEGAFGFWGPLTITYKTAPTAEPTKLVVNSVTGFPWTKEDEQSWQEGLKREGGKSPPDAPAPKPAKP